MINIQENLKENISKVFEKLREEGKKGIKTVDSDGFYYPIKETCFDRTRFIDKNYSNYMKLIQVLERLINMNISTNCNCKFIDENILFEEIELIQNTMNYSLNENYISQYYCLIKCYESLLKLQRQLGFENKNIHEILVIAETYKRCKNIALDKFKYAKQIRQNLYKYDNNEIFLLPESNICGFRGKKFEEIYIDKDCDEKLKITCRQFCVQNSEFNLKDNNTKECRVYEV